jgi:hypothetical protein
MLKEALARLSMRGSGVAGAGRASVQPGQTGRLSLRGLFFFDLDAERLQELEILIVDFKFRVGGKSGNQRCFVGGLFSLLAYSDGGLEDEENVVAALFDARDDFGDLFGIRERFVDGLAKFLHEFFESIVHWVPLMAFFKPPYVHSVASSLIDHVYLITMR